MQSESRPDISIPLPSPKDGMLHFDCFTNISSALHGSTSKGFDAKLHWAALRTSIHLQLPCPPIPSLLSLSIPLSPPPPTPSFLFRDNRRFEASGISSGVYFLSLSSFHLLFIETSHSIKVKSSSSQSLIACPTAVQSSVQASYFLKSQSLSQSQLSSILCGPTQRIVPHLLGHSSCNSTVSSSSSISRCAFIFPVALHHLFRISTPLNRHFPTTYPQNHLL